MEDDYLQENVGYAFLTTQEAISIFEKWKTYSKMSFTG